MIWFLALTSAHIYIGYSKGHMDRWINLTQNLHLSIHVVTLFIIYTSVTGNLCLKYPLNIVQCTCLQQMCWKKMSHRAGFTAIFRSKYSSYPYVLVDSFPICFLCFWKSFPIHETNYWMFFSFINSHNYFGRVHQPRKEMAFTFVNLYKEILKQFQIVIQM